MQKFDLIVIGSGSGLDVANAASQRGLKVAIVEKSRDFNMSTYIRFLANYSFLSKQGYYQVHPTSILN